MWPLLPILFLRQPLSLLPRPVGGYGRPTCGSGRRSDPLDQFSVANSPAELSAAQVAERLANVARFRRALEDADAAAASHADFAPGRVREAIGRTQVRHNRVVDFRLGPSFPKYELRSCADRGDPFYAEVADYGRPSLFSRTAVAN